MSLTWTAGPDGVKHATAARASRTLCGLWPTSLRLDWPQVVRCPQCRERAEARLHAERDGGTHAAAH